MNRQLPPTATGPRPRRPRGGFTLIEVVVTLIVLGTLAGIGTPLYYGHVRDSRIAALQAAVHQAVNAGDMYSERHTGEYTGLDENILADFDYRTEPQLTTRIGDVTADDFCVAVSDSRIDHGTYVLSMVRSEGVIKQRPCPIPAPDTPTLTVEVGKTTATIAWKPTPAAVITSIWRCEGPECDPTTGVLIGRFGSGTTGTADTGLTPGVFYRYVAIAELTTRAGTGTTASEVVTDRYTLAPPVAPNLSGAVTDESTVDLTWTVPATTDTITVYRCAGVACDPVYAGVAVQVMGPEVTGYTDTNLAPGTTYRYVVVADNTLGATGGATASTPVAVAYTLAAPPVPALSVLVDQPDAQVTWSSPPGTKRVDVYRCAGAGCDPTAGTFLGRFLPGVTALTDRNLLEETTYRYMVVADNTVGTTGGRTPSEVVAVRYTVPPPPKPRLSAVPASTSSVNLTWPWPTLAKAVELYRCAGDACDPTHGVRIATLAAKTTSYLDTGLTAGATYRYVAVAANTGGRATSDPVSAVPNAGPFGAGVFANTSVTLTNYAMYTVSGSGRVIAGTNGTFAVTPVSAGDRIDRISFFGTSGTVAERCSGSPCSQATTDVQDTPMPLGGGLAAVQATLAACKAQGPLTAFSGSELNWRPEPYCFSSFKARNGFQVRNLPAGQATLRIYVDGGPVTFEGNTGSSPDTSTARSLAVFSTGSLVTFPTNGFVAAGVWAPYATCTNLGKNTSSSSQVRLIGSFVCDTVALNNVGFWYSPTLAAVGW